MSNVKITVAEQYDLTLNGSAASSDIVYIPGFSAKEDAPKNSPMLVSTVKDFLNTFGGQGSSIADKAYKLTEEDAAFSKASRIGVKAGDVDRSFLMAVELLNAGVQVIYENVCPDAASANERIIATAKTPTADRVEMGSTSCTYTTCKETATEKINFQFRLDPEKFTVENGKVSGSAVVALKTIKEHEGVTLTLGDVSVVKTDGVVVSKDNITLTAVDSNTLEFLAFSVSVTISQGESTVEGNKVEFAVNVTDGADVPVVETSHLKYLYDRFSSDEFFTRLTDKGTYSVKYITSGGYPTYFVDDQGMSDNFMTAAATRGDAVAIIDHEYAPEKPLGISANSIYKSVNEHFKKLSNATYAAMFTPYGVYSLTRSGVSVVMPASFGYLMSLATAIQTSPNWLAMAGVTRGLVPGYTPIANDPIITNVIAEDYQPKFGDNEANVVGINAITNIRPYGQCIWGNRTLYKTATQSQGGATPHCFLNTRNMISDIKKVAYTTAKELMFEQNSDTLWLKFKSGVSPLLEQLRNGNGISKYQIIKGATHYDGSSLARNELAAIIRVYPRYAVEYFEVTIVVSDEDVAVD